MYSVELKSMIYLELWMALYSYMVLKHFALVIWKIVVHWIMQMYQVLTHFKIYCKEVLYTCFSFFTWNIKTTCTQGLWLIIFTALSKTFVSKTGPLLQVHGSEGISDDYYSLTGASALISVKVLAVLPNIAFVPSVEMSVQWKSIRK